MKELIKTPIKDFTIRFATEKDVTLILHFIKQLAEYEKLLYEVEATEQLITKYIFGDEPRAEVIVGEYKKEPVGFALFFHNFSTFLGKPGIYLEDLFINSESRGKGFGKAMLTFLAKTAEERDCGRLEWSVLDWNKSAIDFYKELGAQPMDEWTVFRLTGISLEKLAAEF
jgi:GNAT superfamily N-acetyltransferase